MKVKLITYTNDAEKIVAAAAKTCYSSDDMDTLFDGLTEEKTDKFLNMLMSLEHTSPIEHASFTFSVSGVSRSLLAQLTRHRIASFSVRSQRYVRESGFSYVIPPEIEKNEQAKKVYLQAMECDLNTYNKLTDILFKEHFEAFLSQGKDEKAAKSQAEKKAIEDARYVLPNACDTSIVMTFNARSLYNFFELRCCERAQWEIRDLALEMFTQVAGVCPTLFQKAGPSCVHGACSEGKMTCGKAVEIREKYLGLLKK